MRVKPKAPAQYFKTYAIHSPIATHYRTASCKEVECQHNLKGWVTKLDGSTALGASTANWIRMHSGRRYTYEQQGVMVTFTFPPGQKCFIEHKVSLQRPELFVVQGGDWRGNPMSLTEYKHRNAEDWVEDFAIHQDKVATAHQRG
jgi:hypothetical protein